MKQLSVVLAVWLCAFATNALAWNYLQPEAQAPQSAQSPSTANEGQQIDAPADPSAPASQSGGSENSESGSVNTHRPAAYTNAKDVPANCTDCTITLGGTVISINHPSNGVIEVLGE